MWSFGTGKACYDGNTTVTRLSQYDDLNIGLYSFISFTISGLTQGGLKLESIAGKPVYTANGTYTVSGLVIQNSIAFTPYAIDGDMFIGCLDDVSAWVAPSYKIVDSANNVVFESTDLTGVTSERGYVQYILDWSGIATGIYKIVFNDGIIEYESDCICLKAPGFNIVLSWYNDSDAYGFDYTDLEFRPQIRAVGKLWKPTWPKEKDVFVDNAGTGIIISSRTRKKFLMELERLPEYLHNAIAIGLEHDHFFVTQNGVTIELVNEDDNYAPEWKNHSNLAPSKTELYPKRQNLINTRCGGTLE